MSEEEKLRLPKSLLGGFDEMCPNFGRRMRYNRIAVRRCVVVHPGVRNAEFGAFLAVLRFGWEAA